MYFIFLRDTHTKSCSGFPILTKIVVKESKFTLLPETTKNGQSICKRVYKTLHIGQGKTLFSTKGETNKSDLQIAPHVNLGDFLGHNAGKNPDRDWKLF